jgi:tetratricopeptide (TPR) repeat protein
VDGVRSAAELTDNAPLISQLRAVGILQILPSGTSKKSKGEDSAGIRPLNVEIVGGPPLDAEDMEKHLTTVKQVYRRIDWINLYDFLGIANSVSDEEVQEAIHERARLFHPDHALKAPFGEFRDALETLFRRVKQAQRVFKSSESRKGYDYAQDQGGQSIAIVGGGPTREIQLDIAKRNYQKSRELFEMGDYFPAYEMIRQSVEFEPERPEYWIMLSRIQRKNPKWARQASETLRRALGKNPDNVDLLFELSECYGFERNQNERSKALNEILKLDPGNRRAQASLAEIASTKPGR